MAKGKTNCGGGLASKGMIYAGGLTNPIALSMEFNPKKAILFHSYDMDLPVLPNQIVWVYADAETQRCDCMYLDDAGENFVVEQGVDWEDCTVCGVGFDAAGNLAFAPMDGYKWIGNESSAYVGYSYVAWG